MIKKIKSFLERNAFWLIMTAIAVSFTSCYFFILNSGDFGSPFIDSYFGKKMTFVCKPNDRYGNKCLPELRKKIANVCKKMENAGLAPTESLIVYVYQFDKCNPYWEQESSCYPAVYRKRVGAANMYLSRGVLKNAYGESVLTHEVTHALLSRINKRMKKVVKEFFSTFTANKINRSEEHIKRLLCVGEEWNQMSLATANGNYPEPTKQVPISTILDVCRYGQLEHISEILNTQFPDLHKKLWNKLISSFKNSETFQLDAEMLVAGIREINPKAANLIQDYAIFKNTDGRPHAGMVRVAKRNKNNSAKAPDKFYIIFTHQMKSATQEYFKDSGEITLTRMRGGKFLTDILAVEKNGGVSLDGDAFQRGDLVFIKTKFRGHEAEDVFVIQ